LNFLNEFEADGASKILVVCSPDDKSANSPNDMILKILIKIRLFIHYCECVDGYSSRNRLIAGLIG
jgi:hypothetical protein